MNVTWVLAWRNLWRHRRRTWLTVGAMVFCNILLVFLVSLQFGAYQMMIDGSLAAYTGHIQIQKQGYLNDQYIYQSVPEITGLASQLRAELGVDTVGARAEAFALASSAERSFGIMLTGVQPAYEPGVSTFPGKLREGRYLAGDNAQEIVIGAVLAENLKVGLGDELTFLGSGRDGSFAAAVATVVGILDTGLEEVDRSMAQVPLGWFQQVFSMGDHGHSVVVRLPSLERVPAATLALGERLRDRDELTVLDWDALMPGLRQAIDSDMASAWFQYAILVVLVAFSVLNTQLMSVLERTREFGVMLSLGLRPQRLAHLVGMETLLLAIMGMVLGMLGGGLLSWYLSYAGFSYPGMEEMAARFMLPDRMYPEVSLLSMSVGPLAVFGGAMLAALYPALRLFRLQPVAAMKEA